MFWVLKSEEGASIKKQKCKTQTIMYHLVQDYEILWVFDPIN